MRALTTIAPGAPLRSASVMPRPRTMRVPSVEKYSGPTPLRSNWPSFSTVSMPATCRLVLHVLQNGMLVWREAVSTSGSVFASASSFSLSRIVCAAVEDDAAHVEVRGRAPDPRRIRGACCARCSGCGRTARLRRAARPTARPEGSSRPSRSLDLWCVPSRAPDLRSPVRLTLRSCTAGASPVTTPATSAASRGEHDRARIAQHARRRGLRDEGRAKERASRLRDEEPRDAAECAEQDALGEELRDEPATR